MTDAATPDARSLAHAQSLLELDRPLEAVPLLQQVVASSPESAEAWCLLSQALLAARQVVAAVEAAQRAIGLAPDSEWAFRLLALAELRAGGKERALAAAREAVRLAPQTYQTHVVLANVLSARNPKDPAARQVARRAVELAPHSADAHFTAGAVAFAARDTDAARASLESALALDPQHAAARNELARVDLAGSRWLGTGRMATAAHGFADVARLAPADDVGRRNVDLVLHAVLARSAYLVFVVAWLSRGAADASSAAVRAIPGLLMLVPLVYVGHFVGSLSPALRAYFWTSLRRPRLAACAALMVVAIGCLVVLPLAPTPAQPVLAGVGLGCALVSRGALAWTQPAGDGRPIIGTWLVWVIFGLLAAMWLLVLVGVLSDPSVAADGGWALVLVLAALPAWPAVVLWRRHRRTAQARMRQGGSGLTA